MGEDKIVGPTGLRRAITAAVTAAVLLAQLPHPAAAQTVVRTLVLSASCGPAVPASTTVNVSGGGWGASRPLIYELLSPAGAVLFGGIQTTQADGTFRLIFDIEQVSSGTYGIRTTEDQNGNRTFDAAEPSSTGSFTVPCAAGGGGDAPRVSHVANLYALLSSLGSPDSRIEIVSLATMATGRTISLGAIQASSLAVSPDRARAYVADGTNGAVAVIDLASGARAASLPAPDPRDVVLDAAGATLYASTSGRILAFDTATNAQLRSLAAQTTTGRTTPDTLLSVALSPSGATLAMIGHDGSSSWVYLIDAATFSLLSRFLLTNPGEPSNCATAPNDLVFATDARLLLWDSNCDNLYEVDVATRTQNTARTVRLGRDDGSSSNYNNAVSYSAAADKAFVHTEGGAYGGSLRGHVGVIDTAALKGAGIVGLGGTPFAGAMTPDGRSQFVGVVRQFEVPGAAPVLHQYDVAANTFHRSVYTFATTGLMVRDMKVLAAPPVNTFIVNSAGDSDDGTCGATHCTLREAINAANATANLPGGADRITFAIPPTGTVPVISLLTELPVVTDALTIDGRTQPGQWVALDGGAIIAVPNVDQHGLHLRASGSLVRGLIVTRFPGAGIRLSGAGGITVAGNRIGTDFVGGFWVLRPNGGSGVLVTASPGNTIGGTASADRNILSGNTGGGVTLVNSPNNAILGNYIGLGGDGTSDVRNEKGGVRIFSSATNVVRGNVISANNLVGPDSHGVLVDGAGSTGNVVAGNLIGPRADGTAGPPNVGSGVLIRGGASNNTIGGPTTADRNVISNNREHGVHIASVTSTDNRIQGNYVGLAPDGASAMPNGTAGSSPPGAGIFLSDLAGGVGTPGANIVSGNVVSGNIAYGISILRASGAHSISGNLVGLAANGLAALGNSSVGINVSSASGGTIQDNVIAGNACHGMYLLSSSGLTISGNLVGVGADGTTPLAQGCDGIVVIGNSDGNTLSDNVFENNAEGIVIAVDSSGNAVSGGRIRSNRLHGIRMGGDAPSGSTSANRVTGGSITANGGKGISLINGANAGIARPVVTDVQANGRLVVSGTAIAGATVQIYADPVDEGQTFLGTTTANVDGTWSKSSGWVIADTSAVQGGLRAGTLVATATQTDQSGNTSEFSLGRGAPGAIVGRAQHRETDGTTVTTTVLPGALVRLLSGSVEVGFATADAEGVYVFSNAAANASFSVSYKKTVGTRTYTAGVSFTTDARGNADVPPPNAVLNRKNHTWLRAYALTVGTPTSDVIREAYQTTWYKVPVTGGQRLTVRLENNPQDNVLLGYLDVRKKAEALIKQSTTLPAMKTFLAGSTVAMGDLDSGDLDSGDLDSGDLDSGDLDSGDLDSGDLDSGDLDSGDLDSGDLDSGDLDSGDLDSGDVTNYNGPVYRSAQTQALRWASQHAGPATEEIVVNTRGYTGYLYFRVRGNDGVAAAPNDEFRIVATSESLGSGCTAVVTGAPTAVPSMPSGVRTLLLTDTAALGLTGAAATDFLAMLRTNLATAPGVGGHVYDLSTNAGLATIRAVWKPGGNTCVAQANAYAEAVRELVLQFWAANSLEYLVLVGGDPVVPYFRRTDTAHIARESQYGPGLDADSAGEASLVRDNLMTSDPYGVRTPVTVVGMDVSVPELGIGRIGETVEDITSYALKYRAGTGLVRDPDKLLSTGYDFTLDLQTELEGKLAARGVTTRTSLNTNTWSSEDLRNAWLRGADRYGIVSLQGHFTATRLIPADNGVRLLSTEIGDVTDGRFDQRLVLTIGCHSLFNIHDSEAGLFTLPRSFPEAFMYQGATAVGNPNFGYGETVLIYNSERLMTLLVSELGYSQDPSFAAYAAGVPVGQALNNAKRAYVARIAVGALRGIDVKVLSAAVFGMPHFATALPSPQARPADWLIGPASGGALGSPDSVSIASATSISTTPSAKSTAGLSTADVAPAWTLRRHDTAAGSFYDTGTSGGVSAPYLRPIAPLASTNVHAHTTGTTIASSAETLARGAVLLNATYSDQAAFTPRLASAPYQSATAPATVYGTSVFAPSRIFVLNQLGGGETLNVTPFQYQSDAAGTSGTARTYSAAALRVYYSTRTGAAALADPPAIRPPLISATAAGHLAVSVDVAGGPGAEIEDVYVTYTATSGPLYGRWRSIALTADATITTTSGFVRTYKGTIDPQDGAVASVARDPSIVRVFLQAVGETGVASLLNNAGANYRLVTESATAAAPKRATTLNLTAPSATTYRSRIAVSSVLRDGAGAPVPGKAIRFTLGSSSSTVVTNAAGVAATDLSVEVMPAGTPYTLVTTFREDLDSLGATASTTVGVSRGPTTLTGTAAPMPTGGGGNVATLTLAGRVVPLADQTVHVTANGKTLALATDGQGRVRVDAIDFALAAGLHDITVRFPGGRRYVESVVTVTVPVFDPGASVSGGGWVTTATTSLGVPAGKRATFALSVRYKEGATTPSGSLVLQLKEASIDLKASAFDWMVQRAGRAEMEGSATMAGKATWRFHAVVTDGASADTFEISIWDSADPSTSYTAPRYRFGGTVGGGTVKAR